MHKQVEVQSSHSGEKGSALIIALIMMLVLSALAASLVFITQIEVSSATLYKETEQARYVAESGAQSVEDWLAHYNTTGLTPDLTKIDGTKYPALYNGNPVLLVSSGWTGSTANYPDSTAASNFSSYFNSSTNGNNIPTVPGAQYNIQAQLMSARTIRILGGGTGVLQSWKVTSQGNVTGVRNAQSQVKLDVTNFPSTIFNYGAFGDSTSCSAIYLNGLASTDSYDSSQGPWNSSTNSQLANGNVGSNGSTDLSGANAVIHGMDAWSNNACGAPSGSHYGTVKQISPLVLPPVPTWNPPGSAQNCGSTITPGTYCSSVSISGQSTVTLSGSGTYYMDALSISGKGSITVSPPGSQVVIIINPSSSGPSISGNGISNVGTGDSPANFQIVYGGTGASSIVGNGTTQAVLYAPKSNVSVTGNGGLMGAVYGNTVSFVGGAQLHYDRQLADSLNTVGPYKTTSFSWDKY